MAAADAELWAQADHAKAVLAERAQLGGQIETVRALAAEFQDVQDYIALATEEEDRDLLEDSQKRLERLARRAESLRLESLLTGEADSNPCYLEIHAGAGGTESQDWAEMLLRMYHRWADRRGFATSILDRQDGVEAGIKSASLKIEGAYAYGWIKTEQGIHRLVRISPFDSNARRHTSFASVTVYPVVDETIDIEIQDKDIRVDTYRASGAGGQHVNKTDSAVRITHVPTGIAVQCQNDRSQHKNRATAMKMLRARLYEITLEAREQSLQEAYEARSEIGWGHQIRSYVLHPYRMVKDLRTQVENSMADAVLDGDIDAFLEAALAQQGTGSDSQS